MSNSVNITHVGLIPPDEYVMEFSFLCLTLTCSQAESGRNSNSYFNSQTQREVWRCKLAPELLSQPFYSSAKYIR